MPDGIEAQERSPPSQPDVSFRSWITRNVGEMADADKSWIHSHLFDDVELLDGTLRTPLVGCMRKKREPRSNM